MKLLQVKLKNFKSYPNTETILDLNFQGRKLIVGKNGVGKTTFFDAIIWGIYGKSMAQAEDVVSWNTGKDCKVEVVFSINSDKYSIIRYRNHHEKNNDLLFFKNKKNVSARIKNDTQAKIDEEIQISYQAMVSSIILSSELYVSFLRSKPSERLKAFESILSLKDVNEYAKKLKKLREPLTEAITKLETDKIKNHSSYETLNKTIEEYSEKAKQNLLSLKDKRQKIKDDIEDLESKVDEFKKIDVDAELKSNEEYDKTEIVNSKLKLDIETEVNRIKTTEELNKQQDELMRRNTILKSIDILLETHSINDYDIKLEKNKKIEEGITKLKNTIKDVSFLTRRMDELKHSLIIVNKELLHLSDNENKCPVCNQLIEKELTEVLKSDKIKQVETIEKEIKEYEKEKKEKDLINDKAEKGISKLKELILELPEKSKYTKEELEKTKNEIEANDNKIINIQNEIFNINEYNNEIELRIIDLKKQIKENLEEPKFHTIFLNDLKVKIKDLELQTEELRSEVMVIDTQAKSIYDKSYVEETKKKIKSLMQKESKIVNTLDKQKTKDNHYDVLSQVFSNKEVGFKKFFINKMIKTFNDRVNFYIPLFFNYEIKVFFDKDLNETILRKEKEINFNSLSSGQKARIELAIAFAMFMMVKTFFSKSVNILVFDEILDHNLDQEGFASVIDILDNLALNNSVFVVSHQDYYKENFNHHIEIRMTEDEFSYIHKEV